MHMHVVLKGTCPYINSRCLQRLHVYGLHAYAVKNAKEVSQAETKGKSASEAPLKPSVWKGEQVGQLASCCPIHVLYVALYAKCS